MCDASARALSALASAPSGQFDPQKVAAVAVVDDDLRRQMAQQRLPGLLFTLRQLTT